MINRDNISNITILSDSNQLLIRELSAYLEDANSYLFESKKVIQGDKMDLMSYSMNALHHRDRIIKKVLQATLGITFFVEALINIYAEETKSYGNKKDIESFLGLSLIKKWELLFPKKTKLKDEIQELAFYRNFIIHSKPGIRKGKHYLTYTGKNGGWLKADQISKYLKSNSTGLIIEPLSSELLFNLLNLVNISIDTILEKSPNFNRHYNFRIETKEIIYQFNLFQEKYNQAQKDLMATKDL